MDTEYARENSGLVIPSWLGLGREFRGRRLWIVDAHRDDGERLVIRSDEMLSAFLELERITQERAASALLCDDCN